MKNKSLYWLLSIITIFQIKLISSSDNTTDSKNKDIIAKMAIVAKNRPMALEFTKLLNPIQEIIFEYLDCWEINGPFQYQRDKNISLLFANEISAIKNLVSGYENCPLLLINKTGHILENNKVKKSLDLTKLFEDSISYLLKFEEFKDFRGKNSQYISVDIPYKIYSQHYSDDLVKIDKKNESCTVYISKNGNYIAKLFRNTLYIINNVNSKNFYIDYGLQFRLSSFCFSQDEKYMAVSFENKNTVDMYSLENFKLNKSIVNCEKYKTPISLTISANSKYLVAVFHDQVIVIFDIITNKVYRKLFNSMPIVSKSEISVSADIESILSSVYYFNGVELRVLVNKARELRNSQPL